MKPMTEQMANDVYSVLVEMVGARESGREEFVYHQTNSVCTEFRFIGSLGFGGKFWRISGRRHDDSWGEVWIVNQYPEDERDGDKAKIYFTNILLANLFKEWDNS